MAPTMPATRDTPAHEVLVIGGGVAGLSAAAVLLEAGYSVQVAARELGEHTTSAVAAAFWYPYRAYPEDQVTRLAAVSLRRFAGLMDDASTGVLRRDALEIYPAPVAAPAWSSAADGFAVAEPELLPPGYGFGYRFRTAVVETPIYLEWLQRRVVALGGRVERRTITSLDAALAECPRVINCAGLGARTLTDDPKLRPVRGQVVRVENPGLERVWIDEHSGHGITYIVPRSRDVVLGGTSEDDQEDRTPDPRHTREIFHRCVALEPRLAGARIVSVAVGLRPARSPLRLETEVRPGGLVVHNYGHGGAGVTLSWGCAEAVTDLLQGSVSA
jgi:D-amino-acid oxidase